ncbi:MAG: Stf0 family sulfotransferase [Roseovarius sp.]
MEDPYVSAASLLGLLDEIGFVEKLFWQLPPGFLLAGGPTKRALEARFGYPGLHVPVDAERLAAAGAPVDYVTGKPVYVLGDFSDPSTIQKAKDVCADRGVRVVDVMRDLYPAWCAGGGSRATGKPARIGAIICPARSGSTYLSNILSSSGQLGNIREHMRHHVAALSRTGNIDLLDWLAGVSAKGQKNGVFVTKIVHGFLAGATGTYSHDAWQNLLHSSKDWTLVSITREDCVARAVSTYIAESAARWHVHDAEAYARLEAKANSLEYDFARLKDLYEMLKRQDDLADRFLAERGGPDLSFTFEDIVSDGVGCATRILQHLDLDTEAARNRMEGASNLPRSSSTRKNEEFISKLRSDLGDRIDR